MNAPLDIDAIAPEALPGVRVLPVVHGRVDMAGLVRAVVRQLKPGGVAVEIPTTLARAAVEAVARLPRMSVVISEDDGDGEALIWTVVPGEPFAEALRWALEEGAQPFFIDPDVRYVERHDDVVPDPAALWSMNPAAYLDLLSRATGRAPTGEADALREAGMAYHVQRAMAALDGAPLLVLVGAAHAHRLAARLGEPTAQPLARTRRLRIQVRHLHPDSLTAILDDPPLAHAIHERAREDDLPDKPPFEQTLATRIDLVVAGLRLVSGRGASQRAERGQALVDFATHLCAHAVTAEARVVDRHRLSELVWAVGAASYERQTRETVAAWQHRLFHDFARRYARVQGHLVPSLFEWVVAARGVGDDNLAWEVFDAARTYPWQDDEAEIPTARIEGDQLDLGTRRVTFRRRFFQVKRRLVRVPVQSHPEAADPAEWLEGFAGSDAFGLCSYPPEDLVIEDYGRFLQHKAVSLLSSERTRTEPFTASLLDGIDLRETLRNVHEDRIYVKELGRVPGSAGSVVVIFDRDPDDQRYPYLMTWLGEHDEESDMAFYATNPAQHIVGPGITRATYGGFMMTMPPGRLYDVWRDPEYRLAGEKAEVLIMAAVDYSTGRLVVHVGPDAPSERMRRYAGLRKRRLVHIPLGTLSPVSLRRIRVVHLLAGHDKRAVAKRYIW